MRQITLLLLVSTMLSSCLIFQSPQSKQERKDNDALQRVLAKKDLLDQAYAEAAKNRPCNDSLVKYVKGKADTVLLESLDIAPEVDVAALTKKIADSIAFSFSDDYREGMRQAAAAAYAECEDKWRKQKIPAPRVDTVWYEDGRKIEGWRLMAHSWEIRAKSAESVIQSNKAAERGTIRLQWWFAAIILVVILIAGALLGKFLK